MVRLSPTKCFWVEHGPGGFAGGYDADSRWGRSFCETLLAEGAVAYHGGNQKSTVKVRAAQERWEERHERSERPAKVEKPEPGDQKWEAGGKRGDGKRQLQPCRFFMTDNRCRLGANCS